MGEAMVGLCGGLALHGIDGRPVDLKPLGGRRGRLLFAHLVTERRPVSREALADLLWPSGPPSTWPSALRTALTSVRQVARAAGWGDDPLDTALGLVRLEVPDTVVLDVDRADTLVRDAELALARAKDISGHTSIGATREALLDTARDAAREAAALLHLPPLPELDDDWAEGVRRRTHQSLVRALEAWATATLAAGRLDEAIQVAERVIALEPLRETAHRTVIAAHRDAGRRSDALRAFERVRSALVDELGVAPSAATHALYLELLELPEWATVPAAAPHGLPVAFDLVDEPYFVGRRDSMDRLTRWWDDASADASMAMLRGESGVGKSRLARELARHVHRNGGAVLHATVDEGAGPLDVLHDLAHSVPQATTLLGDIAFSRPDDDVVASLHDLADLVVASAGDRRLLVVVDDLHWATRPLLIVLRRLLARTDTAAVRIVVTARGEAQWSSGWAALVTDADRRGRLLDVPLEGLATEEVADLIGHETGAGTEPYRGLAAELCSQTAGNALLVSQAIRHLADTGRLQAGLDDRLPSPADLAAAVRRPVVGRVAALGDGVPEVLRVAAVLGPSFDLVLLAELVDGGLDPAVRAVDAAIGGALVHSVGDRPGTCRFVHALVREALLQSLSVPARLALHQRAAAALSSGRHAPDPFALAWHLVEASPLGGPVEAARAARAAEAAAAIALRSFDHDSASALLRRALALGVDDDVRASLLVLAGEAGLVAGESSDAHLAFVEAFRLARQASAPRTAARAALGAMRGFRDGSEWMPEIERRELGEVALTELPDTEVLLRVELLGQIALRTPEQTRRQQLAAEAMRIGGSAGDDATMMATLVAGRISLWEPERAAERLRHGRLVEEAATRFGDHGSVIDARFAQLGDLLQLARLDEVHHLLARLDEDPAVQRSARRRWQRRLWDVVLAMVDGRVDDIAPLAARAFEQWGDDTHVDALQALGNQLAVAAAMSGQLGTLLEQIRSWSQAHPGIVGFAAVHAWSAAQAGHTDEARRVAADVRATGLPEDNTLPVAVVALAEVAWALDDATLAQAILPSALRCAGQLAFLPGPCLFFGPADHTIALLQATIGARANAIASLDAAVGLGTRCSPYWHDRSSRLRSTLTTA